MLFDNSPVLISDPSGADGEMPDWLHEIWDSTPDDGNVYTYTFANDNNTEGDEQDSQEKPNQDKPRYKGPRILMYSVIIEKAYPTMITLHKIRKIRTESFTYKEFLKLHGVYAVAKARLVKSQADFIYTLIRDATRFSGNNGIGDAAKHTFWMAILTNLIGEDAAWDMLV